MAARMPFSLVRSEESIMREPTFTTRPPSKVGSTLGVQARLAAESGFEHRFEFGGLAVIERAGGGDLGVDLAALARAQRLDIADDVEQQEQPALGGEHQHEARVSGAAPISSSTRPCLWLVRRG